MAFLFRFCKQIDQRFPVSQEHEFVKSLDRSFDIPVFCISFVGFVFTSFHYYWYGWWPLQDQELAMAIGTIKNFCLALMAILGMITVVARRCLACQLCPISMERWSLVMCCVTQTLEIACNNWYLGNILGVQESYLWSDNGYPGEEHDFGAGRTEEILSVLFLNVVITTGCVVLPIRSHVLWVLPASGIGAFCSLTYLAGPAWKPTLPMIMGYLILMSGMSLWGGFRKEAYLRKEWLAQQEVEKQMDMSEKQRQGFSDLLCRLSDCLLLLGPDLQILDPCPNLAAMLLLGSKQVHNTCFSDYLASGYDCDSFAAAMGRDISEAEPSGVLSLHLKDSRCREVQVHAYYTSFYAKDSSRYHIVGLVEAAERPLPIEDRAERVTQCISNRVGSASGSDRSSVISIHTVGDDLGEISVVISAHEGHEVVSCSTGFTALCGASCAGVSFEDWLVNSSQLIEFIDQGVKDFVDNHDFQQELVLRIPSSSCEFIASQITIDAIAYTGKDDPQKQQFTVRLRLDQLRQRRKAKKKRKDKRKLTNTSVTVEDLTSV